MPGRTKTTHLTRFTRPGPDAVTYDLSQSNVVIIALPPQSTWTSGLHWHEDHTEYLQVLQGHILVTLGKTTKEHGPINGVIEVGKFVHHEWQLVPENSSVEDVIVREWTVPADGQKEDFFRMLISSSMEEKPEKMHRQLLRPMSFATPLVEQWVLLLQVFVIFHQFDNWPVLVGNDGYLGWATTHVVLFLNSWIARLTLGLQPVYAEYVSHELTDWVQDIPISSEEGQ